MGVHPDMGTGPVLRTMAKVAGIERFEYYVVDKGGYWRAVVTGDVAIPVRTWAGFTLSVNDFIDGLLTGRNR